MENLLEILKNDNTLIIFTILFIILFIGFLVLLTKKTW